MAVMCISKSECSDETFLSCCFSALRQALHAMCSHLRTHYYFCLPLSVLGGPMGKDEFSLCAVFSLRTRSVLADLYRTGIGVVTQM